MKQLKVGLLGLGRIGKVHLENLVYRLPVAKVVAVSDPDASTHMFARQRGIEAIFENGDKVIGHSEVEAIIICSPTHTHLSYIEKAANAGKSIFCEKPLEMTLAKIEYINTIVAKHKVKLQVGFNRRFDTNFMQVQNMVKSGKIGQPHLLKITSRDPSPPTLDYVKVSGGMFMDMTIHDFDMARFIVDSEVTEVFAKGAVLIDKKIGEIGDIDTALITLKFKNNCLGVIDNSRKAVYGYDQRLEVLGSDGMSQIGNNYPDTQILYDTNGRHAALPLNFFMNRYTESYLKEMNAFIKALREGQEVSVNAHDALMATAIALAAKKSMDTNQVVKLKSIIP